MSLETRDTALAQAVGADVKKLQARFGTESTITINFGAGSNEVNYMVYAPSATDTSRITAWVDGFDSTSDHTANDHLYFGQFCSLTCSSPMPGLGFLVYARSIHKLTGTWKVRVKIT